MGPPRLLLLIAVIALAADPALASAADGDRPRPRRKPPEAKPAADAGLRPTLNPLGAPPRVIVALPPPVQSGGGFAPSSLASRGLASGGLRSTLPVLGQQTAQCRTTCSRSRITCDTQDGSPDCAPKWAMCVVHCNH